MAIGDAVAVNLGTATTNRQPSAGVEEQLTALIKNGNTDSAMMYDGSNNIKIVNDNVETHTDSAVSTVGSPRVLYNMAIMSTNGVYMRKPGTTDRIAFFGVQTNS